MKRSGRSPLAVASLVVASLLVVPAVASAQSDAGSLLAPSSTDKLGTGLLGSVTAESLTQPLSLTGSAPFTGSTLIGLMNTFQGSIGVDLGPYAPLTRPEVQPDPTITQTRLVDRKVEGRWETWTIDSAAMNRRIQVEIYRAVNPGAPAPIMYMLDGVDSPLPSGYHDPRGGDLSATLPDAQVNLVIPTGGYGSMWADWQNDDPVLGRMKWETFLTQELPPIVESGQYFPYNGKRGVGGISMGASAAMALATRHPDMYQAVMAVSGCYDVGDLAGALADITVSTRGGTLTNMWGPRGSVEWTAHDSVAKADALRGKTIYMSSATGVAGPGTWDQYDHSGVYMAAGAALEQATNVCMGTMANRLARLGIAARVDNKPQGLHTWAGNFKDQVPVGIRYVLPALR